MIKQERLLEAFNKCDLYLDGKCISKYSFFQEYFRAIYGDEEFNNEKAVAYVSSWHSDSILAGALFFNALIVFCCNTYTVEDSIKDLVVGDTVIYKAQRAKVEEISPRLKFRQGKDIDNPKGMSIGIDRKTWNRVVRYRNKAKTLDGRGVFKEINSAERRAFFHELFGTEWQDVPVEFNTIAVLLVDINRIDYIIRNLKVQVKGTSSMISFLDLFTVTRINSNGADRPYPGNFWGGEPNIYICQNMSGIAGLMHDYQEDEMYSIVSFYSEAEELLAKDVDTVSRLIKKKACPWMVLDIHSSFRMGREIIQNCEPNLQKVFTPLEKFEQETEEIDPLLYEEWDSMGKGKIHEMVYEIGFSEDDYYALLSIIAEIRNNDDEPIIGARFIGGCLGLVHRMLSSVSSVGGEDDFEGSIERLRELCNVFSSQILKKRSEKAYVLVEKLYKEIKKDNIKEKKFYELMVRLGRNKRIAVIAYKPKQVEIIYKRYSGIALNLTVVTPKKFDLHNHYDVIVIVGQMNLQDIPIWVHTQAMNTYVLLYECEREWAKKQRNWFLSNLRTFASKNEFDEIIEMNDESEIESKEMRGDKIPNIDIDNMLNGFMEGIQVKLPRFLESQQTQVGEKKVEIAAIGILDDGRAYLFAKGAKRVYVFSDEDKKGKLKSIEDIEQGDKILYCRDLGNREEILIKVLERQGEKSDVIQKAFVLNEEWKEMLRKYKKRNGLSYEELCNRLRNFGTNVTFATLRGWMDKDSNRIGPQQNTAFQAITRVLQREPEVRSWQEYAEATQIARNMHRKATQSITAHIRKIYYSYCQGELPRDDIEKMLYENMDNLASLLTVEQIMPPVEGMPKVYASLVNCPIELEDIIDG